MAEVLYRDPFNAVLLNSPSLHVTAEQNEYIRDILNVSCSDSKFAEKAYAAIAIVLTAGVVEPPVVTSLVPVSVTLGDPSFDLHVHGTGFNPYSIIVFNGYEEPTTYISDTELVTGVNMPLWQSPVVVPVKVKNFNLLSDPTDFEFVDPAPPPPPAPLSVKTEDKGSYFKEPTPKIEPAPKIDLTPKTEPKMEPVKSTLKVEDKKK